MALELKFIPSCGVNPVGPTKQDLIFLKRESGLVLWQKHKPRQSVAILAAIAVNEDGYREVPGAAEGMKEDRASGGVKLVVGDKCPGMPEAVGEVFPEAKYQRCVVHFHRNIFSVVPRSNRSENSIYSFLRSIFKRFIGPLPLSSHGKKLRRKGTA